jgi:aldose sugar dehydrogenase
MHGTHGLRFTSAAVILGVTLMTQGSAGQVVTPELLDERLSLRVVATGLAVPTSIAFLGRRDLLVLEKNTGQVRRILNGNLLPEPVLDLAVNNASERGLLGIALHPNFPRDRGVYLFWSCRAPAPSIDPFVPEQRRCDQSQMFGEDTDDLLAAPLLGNRVDRFEWRGSRLRFDKHLITLRSFQNDGAPEPPGQNDQDQPPRANHDGGVILFGKDKKLYVLFGDTGRRGQLQNLPSGPTETGLGPVVPDDQFGGPEPDDAHMSGVILRLNDDGTTPRDNPFVDVGARIGGEVGRNIQRIFVYGIRNSFGMAVDPRSGRLWYQENGEDAYDEINRAEAGMNSGWIQIAGPAARVPDFKLIETTSLFNEDFPNLQQFRWGPERIADSREEALDRLFSLPDSRYVDPQFSWRHVVAPAGIGFGGHRLGSDFRGLFVGLSVPEPEGGPLFHFPLTRSRRNLRLDDPRLDDRVADNVTFRDLTESESFLIGRNFGVVTDIEISPRGTVYVVSLDQGAIYEIRRAGERDDDDDDDRRGRRGGDDDDRDDDDRRHGGNSGHGGDRDRSRRR